ncbi:hypothetical protein [Arcticibacter eurypsychrophilus]|uniref:hypothetical protein n=1 Tax=Arcticibacter eurypsychrophilus TaxID=1434752 RepID=UPI00084D0652|nr:hypothetical protein [Arcticibacter eurypsychrophilus]
MKATTAVIIATLYLIVYVILFQTEMSTTILSYLFLTSPFLMIWLVYTVLKDDHEQYPELGEDQEWGYRDKPKDKLDRF